MADITKVVREIQTVDSSGNNLINKLGTSWDLVNNKPTSLQISGGDAAAGTVQNILAGANILPLTLASVTTSSTSSTQTATAGGTITVVDSITTDGKGRVTAKNTKTITLPGSSSPIDFSLIRGLSYIGQESKTIPYDDIMLKRPPYIESPSFQEDSSYLGKLSSTYGGYHVHWAASGNNVVITRNNDSGTAYATNNITTTGFTLNGIVLDRIKGRVYLCIYHVTNFPNGACYQLQFPTSGTTATQYGPTTFTASQWQSTARYSIEKIAATNGKAYFLLQSSYNSSTNRRTGYGVTVFESNNTSATLLTLAAPAGSAGNQTDMQPLRTWVDDTDIYYMPNTSSGLRFIKLNSSGSSYTELGAYFTDSTGSTMRPYFDRVNRVIFYNTGNGNNNRIMTFDGVENYNGSSFITTNQFHVSVAGSMPGYIIIVERFGKTFFGLYGISVTDGSICPIGIASGKVTPQRATTYIQWATENQSIAIQGGVYVDNVNKILYVDEGRQGYVAKYQMI